MVQEILHRLCFLAVPVVQVVLMVQQVLDYLPVPDFQQGLMGLLVQVVLLGQKIQMDLVVRVDQMDR